jgi:hypothetical protein
VKSHWIGNLLPKMRLDPLIGSLFMGIIEVFLIGHGHRLLVDDVTKIMQQGRGDHRRSSPLAFGQQGALQRVLQLGDLLAPIATLASLLKESYDMLSRSMRHG